MDSLRMILPSPPPEKGRAWGDYYFGHSLKTALEALGVGVRVDCIGRTGRPSLPGSLRFWEPDLWIRGKMPVQRNPLKTKAMWLISNHTSVTDAELARIDVLFVASPTYAHTLRDRGFDPVELLQCTDAALFSPDLARDDLACDVLFVGNRRKDAPRPVVNAAIDAGVNLAVWGRKWDNVIPAQNLHGTHIPNSALGAHYASAKVVLADHHPSMVEGGFAANRIYDVLASGTPIVSDLIEGVPYDLRDMIYVYTDNGSLMACIEKALSETDAQRAERRSFAEYVRQNHSFAQRAEVIRARLEKN